MSTFPSAATPADRARARRERNREIVQARERGETWPQIAERFSITRQHARRCYVEHVREAGQVVNLNAGEVFEAIINVHTWALEELRVLAGSADNSSAQVGAIRSRVQTSNDLRRLLLTAGLLPQAEVAHRARMKADHQAFISLIEAALLRHGHNWEEIADTIDDLMRRDDLAGAA
jgi:hypothetical protein